MYFCNSISGLPKRLKGSVFHFPLVRSPCYPDCAVTGHGVPCVLHSLPAELLLEKPTPLEGRCRVNTPSVGHAPSQGFHPPLSRSSYLSCHSVKPHVPLRSRQITNTRTPNSSPRTTQCSPPQGPALCAAYSRHSATSLSEPSRPLHILGSKHQAGPSRGQCLASNGRHVI